MDFLKPLESAFVSMMPQPLYNDTIKAGNVHAKTFPLMNPFHVVLVAVGYLVLILVGQLVMKNMKKFEMFYFSLFHNFSMVCLSAYMCYEAIHQAISHNYTFFGNGVDESPAGYGMAKVLWLFYFSKPIEFIDTFIMVLKKNNHQVSFLHVYHHVATFMIWWYVIYFAPGGDTYFSAAQNCFIHVLMYGYYFLATLKINAPWKYYLTQAQMFQFLLNCIQATYVLYYPTSYPKHLAVVLLVYMISLLVLFGNFYVQSQKKIRATKSKKAE